MRYLAAAHTFGGHRPELDDSAFLDNLGNALHACYETPNTQEFQRGASTGGHRFLTAFLCKFHPTPNIKAIHQAFIEQELKATGSIGYSLFDALFTRSWTVSSRFPSRCTRIISAISGRSPVQCVGKGRCPPRSARD